MEHVLDVYKKPYNKDSPVVCMDETSKQLIRETRKGTPMKKGKDARVDYEYIRCGVCNIFMANEPLAGKGYTAISEQRTKKDRAKFIQQLSDIHYSHVPKNYFGNG